MNKSYKSGSLLIDSGNTQIKIFKTNLDSIQQIAMFKANEEQRIVDFIMAESFNNSILCNVGGCDWAWIGALKTKSSNFINLNHGTRVPLKNCYKTPETLGYDRLAAAVGANGIFPNKDVLVIDIGTAITIDLVCGDKFIGGSISPGMKLRFESLHRHTARLPLLNFTTNYHYPGQNTHDAIISGVVEGIVNEIDGTINSYLIEYSSINVVLTGGDADIFAERIKNSIFAEPYLLAKGLNRILKYNVETN